MQRIPEFQSTTATTVKSPPRQLLFEVLPSEPAAIRKLT
jgi:hypothetical protein